MIRKISGVSNLVRVSPKIDEKKTPLGLLFGKFPIEKVQ